MGSRVILEYPNGRTHETTVEQQLQAGDVFELFGRRWCAVDVPLNRWGRPTRTDDAPLVCKQLETLAER